MKYKTVNETENFIYKDCNINEAYFDNMMISFVVEALIVKATNSKNTNYTDSYAGDAEVNFVRPAIMSVIHAGYKKYDAEDKLIEEVEDKEVSLDHNQMRSMFTGAYLTGIDKESEGVYRLSMELADEDPYAVADVYEVRISCDEVIIEWDKYLNRVQEM